MRGFLGFILISIGTPGLFAQSYTISTAVGAGPPSKVAGKSTSLGINIPSFLTADTTGNVYFVDQNSVIEMNASSGILTIVAGNGTTGYSGDNGPATSAQLNNPQGLAVDSAGDLYIADAGNNVIRKVSGGTITTAAGNGTVGSSCANGAALSVAFNSPAGLALDSHGNLYITDTEDYCVRRLSGGNVTTVAGTGSAGYNGDNQPATSAQLSFMESVAVDSQGNLFIADAGNERVREVNAANGMITTVAGNGMCCMYGGDGGPATGAQLADPLGVAVDSSGDLYITENATTTPGAYTLIRKVTNGTISTFAGDHALGPGFSGDGGPATQAQLSPPQTIALDGSGNLYIADQGNNRIREVSGGTINTIVGDGSIGDNGPASAAQLGIPIGIGLDTAGNLYIADSEMLRIREVTASTGIITTVAGNGKSGTAIVKGSSATSVGLNGPGAVAADKNGSLYIADTFRCQILEVSAGLISVFAGTGTCGYDGDGISATTAEIGNSFGIITDSQANVYFADDVETDISAARVREVSAGKISTFAGNGEIGPTVSGETATNDELQYPTGLAADSHDNIYFADVYNNIASKVSGGIITVVAGNGQQTSTPSTLGDGGPATSATLNNPGGVAVDTLGNIYIADTGNNRIRMVSATTGKITTIAGTGILGYTGDYGPATAAELNSPFDVAVNSAGTIFIADGSGRIRVLTPATSSCSYTGVPSTLPIAAAGGSQSIAVSTTAFCPWAVSGLPGWITLTGPSATTGSGNADLMIAANTGVARSATITIAGTSVSVMQAAQGSTNLCDINNDGMVNLADVKLMIQQGLGKLAPANDLNADKIVNVADIEIDGNAARNLGCSAQD